MNDILHSFPGQEANEPVFVFARPYFVAFLPTFLVFLVIFAFLFFLEYLLLNGMVPANDIPLAQIGLAILNGAQLFALLIFFILIFNFYYTIVIVTDRRLVNIDQEQIFSRRISELQLEEIEDVTSSVNGLLPSVFNYGTVFIQTAGTADNFVMENIRYPREVAALTLSLSEQAKKNDPETSRVPSTPTIGVINNCPIESLEELRNVGAMMPNDIRRTPGSSAPVGPSGTPPPAEPPTNPAPAPTSTPTDAPPGV
ncbi:hypothetical protein KGQ71_04450 [Patescibacteria group bacterium]|nr:hypothetical protein [Patescibacteria group bacterium]